MTEKPQETALTTEALKGMAMTKDLGHTPETEEVPEDKTEEETDLEKEVNLHLEVAGTAATLEVARTAATLEATRITVTPGMTKTTVVLETDPDPEEEETVEDATVERLSMTTSLILGKLSWIKLLKKI